MRSLRILFATHSPADPAAAVYSTVMGRADRLRSLGHSVDVVTPRESGSRLRLRLQPLLFPVRVALLCYREHYDAVVFHSYAGWTFQALRRVLDPGRTTATITAFHGLEPLYHRAVSEELARTGERLSIRFRLLHTVLMPVLIRMSARRSSAVFCLNQEERAFLTQPGWCEPSRVSAVGNGVEQAFFKSRRHSGRGRTLLFLGQWLAAKGTRHLVGAFARLAVDCPDVILICAGTGAPEAAVLDDFPEALRSRVIVRPRLARDGVLAQFAEADVFVFPSLYEGFGKVLLEAMACGVPIVTTNTGAARDLLEDGVSAVLVPFADPGALADGCGRLLGDPTARQHLADRARTIAARYEWRRINEQYSEVLVRIVSAHPSAPVLEARETPHVRC